MPEKQYKRQTIEDLIKKLQKLNPKAEILISSDEELNTLFWGFEISYLNKNKDQAVIFGLSGLEEEE